MIRSLVKFRSKSKEKKANEINKDAKKMFDFNAAAQWRRRAVDRLSPNQNKHDAFSVFLCTCGQTWDLNNPEVKSRVKKAKVLECDKCSKPIRRDFTGVNVILSEIKKSSVPSFAVRREVRAAMLWH